MILMKKQPQKSLTIWAGALLTLSAILEVIATQNITAGATERFFAGLGFVGLRRAMG